MTELLISGLPSDIARAFYVSLRQAGYAATKCWHGNGFTVRTNAPRELALSMLKESRNG